MKFLKNILAVSHFILCCEGDAGDGGGGEGDAGNGGAGNGGEGGAGTQNKKPSKTYTEDEFNRHSAAQRKSYEKQLQAQAAQLTKLSEDTRLTQEERDQYRSQAEQLETQYKTEKQLAEERVAKLSKEAKAREEALLGKNKEITSKYHSLLIETELANETALVEEQIPGTLKKVLKADTILVDELDEETKKPTGQQVVRVNFDDEKDGKPVKLVIPVKEALKRMKEKPERFGIYFKGSGQGGVGGGNGNGGFRRPDGTPPKDTNEYIAQRNASRGKK